MTDFPGYPYYDITDWWVQMGLNPRWSDVVAKIEMYWPEGVPMPEELSQADYLTYEAAPYTYYPDWRWGSGSYLMG